LQSYVLSDPSKWLAARYRRDSIAASVVMLSC
jgi:hypothetical protein